MIGFCFVEYFAEFNSNRFEKYSIIISPFIEGYKKHIIIMMTQSMHYQYIYEYYALAEELKSNATPPLITISIYLDNNRVQSNL